MDPSVSADQYLVEQIRAGDSAAWRQLIDRFSGRLLAFARARIGALSDAEDLVQETLIGFLQSLAHFDQNRSLETYLFTILRYKLYDLLRQRKLPLAGSGGEDDDLLDRTASDACTPSSYLADQEATAQQERLLCDMLVQLIHDLRDRQAFEDLQVIELIFFAGKRNLDVAELLDMDQKAIAGIKFRAIQKLQKFLSDREPAALACLEEGAAEITVAKVWRENRPTCLKRGTLGAYVLGVLEEPWKSYTQFHLDVVGCSMCVANLADIQAEEESRLPADTERIFQSSIGFLSRPG